MTSRARSSPATAMRAASCRQAISAAEAIRQYTNGSAYAVNRDHEVGSLEIGKRADMVVLSHDPTAVDPDYIGEIVVQQTYVDGRLLYDG